MLPRFKLNSIESKISEALINNESSQEDLWLKKKAIENQKRALEWWKVEEVIPK